MRSVALSKKDMQNRTTREAAQCAIDHCNEMARELVPMYTAILDGIRVQGLPLFVSDTSEVSFEKTEETKKINNAIEWMGERGSLRENEVERMMRDAKALQIVEGTNQIQQLVLARDMEEMNQ